MGKNKTTSNQESYSTPQPSAEQSSLIRDLLMGGGLGGNYAGAYGISDAQANEIAGQSIRDIQPFFNGQGLLDSGVNASISARTAGDVRRNIAQFNVGAKQNMLGLGLNAAQGIMGVKGGANTSSYGMNPFLMSFQQGIGNTFGSTLGKLPFAMFPAGRTALGASGGGLK